MLTPLDLLKKISNPQQLNGYITTFLSWGELEIAKISRYAKVEILTIIIYNSLLIC